MFSNDFLALNNNPFKSFLMGGFECADQQMHLKSELTLICQDMTVYRRRL